MWFTADVYIDKKQHVETVKAGIHGLGLGLGLGTLSHRNASSSVALSVAFDSCRQVMNYAYTHAWPIIASDEHRARFAK